MSTLFPRPVSGVDVQLGAGLGAPARYFPTWAGGPELLVDTLLLRETVPGTLDLILAHEVYPGHHLQAEHNGGARLAVFGGLPWTAFVEGWGVYSEGYAAAVFPQDAAVARHACLAHLGTLAQNVLDTDEDDRTDELNATQLKAATYLMGYLEILTLRASAREAGLSDGEFHRRLLASFPGPWDWVEYAVLGAERRAREPIDWPSQIAVLENDFCGTAIDAERTSGQGQPLSASDTSLVPA